MNPTIIAVIEILKKQGFSFLLMGAMLWYLSNELDRERNTRSEEMKALQVQVQACNQANQQLLLNQIDKSNRLLERYETNHLGNARQPLFMSTE